MNRKQRLRLLHDRIKQIAVLEDHEQLLNACSELNDTIESLDDENQPPPPDDGNHPKKPGNP